MSQLTYGQDETRDRMSIEKILTDLTDGWNKHDATSFSILFSEDADFINVRGQEFNGRIEIAKHHAPIFATRFKNSYLKIVQHKIRFIKPDVAAMDAWWEMTGIEDPEGKQVSEKGLMTFILTKNKSTWFISVNHNMSLHN